MSETAKWRLSWVFVASALVFGLALAVGGPPAGASDDHERAREYRDAGRIMPLSQLLAGAELGDYRVLEAELEDEDGRLVYELELLGSDGHVIERYFDAETGSPLGETYRDD